MTDDTVTSVDTDDTSLEDFEKDFYGTTATQVVEEEAEESVEESEDVDDLGEENDPPAPDEDDDSDEDEDEPEEDPQPKKNKNPAQKRIEQLNKQLREQEREYERRIASLEAAVKGKSKEEETPLREQLTAEAPDPDAKDDNGEPLYLLGEFDPKYIRDLSDFTVEQKFNAKLAEQEQLQAQAAEHQMREELKNQWVDRLDKYEEEVPEVRDNIRGLTEAFETLDPGYGEMLAATLMAMDNGPQIMNYLSQNIGEAQKIVSSGPALAILALGRLDAVLAPKQEQEKPKKNKSNAPPPPEDRTRGTNGKFAVAIDTDNLDAFEKEFFS